MEAYVWRELCLEEIGDIWLGRSSDCTLIRQASWNRSRRDKLVPRTETEEDSTQIHLLIHLEKNAQTKKQTTHVIISVSYTHLDVYKRQL